ncbi:hypothetical protein AAHE18_16G059500 [Arachis hypogaea]
MKKKHVCLCCLIEDGSPSQGSVAALPVERIHVIHALQPHLPVELSNELISLSINHRITILKRNSNHIVLLDLAVVVALHHLVQRLVGRIAAAAGRRRRIGGVVGEEVCVVASGRNLEGTVTIKRRLAEAAKGSGGASKLLPLNS